SGRAADERFHMRKDGSRLYCSGVMRRLGSGGKGFAKIARDLTSQREGAEALQRAHDQLDFRVRERTSGLAGARRREARARLAATNLLHRLVTAQEDERRRVARDLHDHFGQQLTALRQTLERARQTQADSGAKSDDIDRALQMTSELGRDVDF